MRFTKEVVEMIKTFIINNINDHPNDITPVTCSHFGITKPTVLKYIRELISDDVIEKTGSNRFPNYRLKPKTYQWQYQNKNLEEDILWAKSVSPLLADLNSDVKEICQYGFTEMVNNVIDHSNADDIMVLLTLDHLSVQIIVKDNGIGIFQKIQKTLGLDHPKQAILELAKGKFTSDPDNHSGEGIFFTSRAFDTFIIFSHQLRFVGLGNREGVMFDVEEDAPGTSVYMKIDREASTKLKTIFDEYADPDKDPSFHRTLVPVELMQHEGEALISRSQAKRLISRFDKFTEVILDFKGVTQIGQGFSDQIFRVFQNKHPQVHLKVKNAIPDVVNMIKRVRSTR